jgi:hypothetical protein
MSSDHVEYHAADPPADLPSCDTIVQQCAAAGFRQNGICFEVEDSPRFWIKYSDDITLGEALTQNQVAQIVNADPTSVVRVPEVYFVFSRQPYRYIVMQHVAGDTVASRQLREGKYVKGDVAAVAAAVKQLTSIRVPAGTSPGHVGGGRIGHNFFLDCQSSCEYPTVGHLQKQINKVCFQVLLVPRTDIPAAPVANKLVAPQNFSVDFSGETAEGLVLCPSNIDPSNFIISSEGTAFAIDFARTGYMPPSFVSYSLTHWKPFTRMVARLVQYPKSANLIAMQVAAGQLVITGNNLLGE